MTENTTPYIPPKEQTVLYSLFHNEQYARKVTPFLKSKYFTEEFSRIIFKLFDGFLDKYNKLPNVDALSLIVSDLNNLKDNTFKNIVATLEDIAESDPVHEDVDFLTDQCEEWCQERAIYLGITKSIEIIDGREKKLGKEALPSILSDAIGVSFNQDIGHDYLDNADMRFKFYHEKENRIPFDLKYLNKITGGGLPRKSISCILAGTGAGKSLAMCHFAAANIQAGYNVLYITLEMAEEKIAERIDANLMDIPMNTIQDIPFDVFKKKIDKMKTKSLGKLIVKQYPTASAGANHFSRLIEDLRIKKKFVPQIIYIDYINLCTSSRFKEQSGMDSYSIIKAISEELRGLAVIWDVPIVTATQQNRGGYGSSDVDLTNTSDSMGLPFTMDLMFALITNEDLDKSNQIMGKQLKNRYNDLNMPLRFIMGIDKTKMRLYDVAEKAQKNISQSNYND